MPEIKLIEKLVEFDEDHHSGKNDTLIIKETQFIPDEFLSSLRLEKVDTLHTPMGDMYRLCSIPTIVVDKWKREGFDIDDPSITEHEILARLRKADLDAFITTSKRF